MYIGEGVCVRVSEGACVCNSGWMYIREGVCVRVSESVCVCM